MEELARRDELDAVFLALFAVLLLLLLLVRLGRGLARIVNGVDRIEVLVRDFLDAHRLARLGDLAAELEVGIIDGLEQTERLGVLVGHGRKVHDVVGDDLVTDLAVHGVVDEDGDGADARVLNGARLLLGHLLALGREQLARLGMEHVVRDAAAGQTVREVELLVELIASHLDHVIAARIKEEVVEVLTHRFLGRDFAGTQTAVERDEAVRLGADGRRILFVAFDGGGDHLVAAEELFKRAVGAVAEGAQKHRGGELALSVHADPQDALRILLEFQPCPAVGDDGRFIDLLARLVRFGDVVDAGRADELGDDDALRAVDDEGPVVRHEREIPHEHGRVDDLVLHLVDETHLDAQRKRIRRIAVAAFLFVVLGGVSELMP